MHRIEAKPIKELSTPFVWKCTGMNVNEVLQDIILVSNVSSGGSLKQSRLDTFVSSFICQGHNCLRKSMHL